MEYIFLCEGELVVFCGVLWLLLAVLSVCHSVALQVILFILLICLSLHSLNFVTMSVTDHYSGILVSIFHF